MTMIATEARILPTISLSGLVNAIGGSMAVRRQRAQLKLLDNDRLIDLGISRSDALSEAKRPAWDIPTQRRF